METLREIVLVKQGRLPRVVLATLIIIDVCLAASVVFQGVYALASLLKLFGWY